MPYNNGRLAEWTKAAVLKTVERLRSVGSNPTFSAIAVIAQSVEQLICNQLVECSNHSGGTKLQEVC